MTRPFQNRLTAIRQRNRCTGAFTLTELTVAVGSAAMLAAVLLSLSFTTQESASRAECTGNLRQIGVGWNLYQGEFNQVMPCNWPGVTQNVGGTVANPWQTYLAFRISLGTTLETNSNPLNLAALFANRFIPNPKLFYCPSLARDAIQFSYDSYTGGSNRWPSASGSLPNPGYIRTGYNYYPQCRATNVYIGSGRWVPQAAVTPTKWTALDTKRSIATDVAYSIDTLAHRSSGAVTGLNALFPDGHVKFQNARSNPQDFNITLWGYNGDPSNIGNNPSNFRYVMSLWQP